ncbi:MAG: DUF507 family protein [Candidatus Coatesbacteria bacterium]|nr:DUF507 family protein [Candidatus Coatesbacteria bacterium]
MRLNDDKISDIAFRLTDHLAKDKRVHFLVSPNIIRACINRTITAELRLEDEIVQLVLDKLEHMASVKRDSPKWEGHFERMCASELAKRGRNWEIGAREVLK